MEHTQGLPRELFKFHKNLNGATVVNSESYFRHFSFLLDISVWSSAEIQVPSEDLVFQLSPILLLVVRRPCVNPVGSWSCAAAPGGLWDPHTHHCCTEIDLMDNPTRGFTSGTPESAQHTNYYCSNAGEMVREILTSGS